MESTTKDTITVETVVDAKIEKVWECWTSPKHIIHWNNASDNWHTPAAENDLRIGGKFKSTMAAKDGSAQFDFEGVYSNVELHKGIEYSIIDGRKVRITFSENENQTKVIETFEAENENSLELQQSGWQSILNNFKSYIESLP